MQACIVHLGAPSRNSGPPPLISCAFPPPVAQASTPLAQADIAGPPVLPSSFLREAIAGFLDRLRQHQAAVAELEAVLVGGAGAQPVGRAG